LKEIEFDLNKFFVMNESDALDYINQYKGLSHGNLEYLADIIGSR